MRKFFSVLLCIILIISICICSSVSGSALFIADDLIYAVGISMAASVLLSIGIAAVSGSDSQYVEFAEACAQITWEQMVQDYTQAEILAMITIQNGKAYFRCPEGLFTRLKNWALNYNWGSVHISSHITSTSADLLPVYTSYGLNQLQGRCAIGVPTSVISFSAPTYQFVYTPGNNSISLILDDGTLIKKALNSNVPNLQSLVLTQMNTVGECVAFRGNYSSGASAPPDAIRYVENQQGYLKIGSSGSVSHNGQDLSITFGSNNRVFANGELIAQGLGSTDYAKQCVLAGRLLSNVDNNILSVNSNSGLTSVNSPVDTETYAPAIPGNRVGSDQTVLVPIPSHFEDPSLPDVPLPQRTVKNRVKRGQEVALVPDLPSLKDKTPQDLGVLVVNNTDIQDTTISPTLNTTVYGDDSTTFVIIPQVPINTPIPNDDNQPLVSSPYPDVINPGNETITVTANDDIFPTADNPPATTARPSVSVSNPDEVASSAASEVVEGVSEIASEAVKDIAEPLTPSDIEKGANRMKLTPQLLHKFPFCIPFDFYNAINQFSAPAEVPQFDIPIRVQSLNFDYNVHVDLTNFETAAKISRWFFSVAWVITLIFLTRKVIWK